jgi:hypothetical protein
MIFFSSSPDWSFAYVLTSIDLKPSLTLGYVTHSVSRLELGIALWLLERQLGIAFLAPAAVATFSTVSILIMAKYIGHAQKIWIQGIQTRVDVTASVLGSMKVGF